MKKILSKYKTYTLNLKTHMYYNEVILFNTTKSYTHVVRVYTRIEYIKYLKRK